MKSRVTVCVLTVIATGTAFFNALCVLMLNAIALITSESVLFFLCHYFTIIALYGCYLHGQDCDCITTHTPKYTFTYLWADA